MNRRALEKHLRACGCFLHHRGGKHDVWVNPATGAHSPVPRHSTIKKGTVRAICRGLSIEDPT
ncbi:MAG: type II toxin-antitoxin system HicA family toxin [Deltaproteobacteria bacterium]|nr:type II toxin-antitoxin system HicA family toxin [Deltaproteobacteria bacterium]